MYIQILIGILFLFKQLPRNFWTKKENLLYYILYLQRTFYIRKKEDWYRLSFDQFAGKKGRGLWRHGGILQSLISVFPDEKWDIDKLKNRSKKFATTVAFNSIF